MPSEEDKWLMRPALFLLAALAPLYALDYWGVVPGRRVFPLVAAAFVIVFFASMLFSVHHFRPAGPGPWRTHIGGVTTGPRWWFGTHATWPFAKLFVGSEGIILAAPWNKYVFGRGEVRMTPYGLFFKSGYRLIHGKTAYPSFIAFLTVFDAGLEGELRGLGYAFEGEPPRGAESPGF
jgi:hypothetical protein